MTKETAIATVDDIERTATLISKASTISPELRGKVADIAVTIMAGQELGLGPMASLRLIHVVKSKPVLSADAMRGLVHASGKCMFFECLESTGKVATYETHRVGARKPQRLSFTIEQAKAAGLAGDNWSKYPDAMLRARASAALARDVYGDVLSGCYTADEALEFVTSTPREAAYRADATDDPPIIDVEPEPAPEPPAIDEVAWSRRIDELKTQADLDTVRGPLNQLPKSDAKVRLRDRYLARVAEVCRPLLTTPDGP